MTLPYSCFMTVSNRAAYPAVLVYRPAHRRALSAATRRLGVDDGAVSNRADHPMVLVYRPAHRRALSAATSRLSVGVGAVTKRIAPCTHCQRRLAA